MCKKISFTYIRLKCSQCNSQRIITVLIVIRLLDTFKEVDNLYGDVFKH